MQKCFSTVKNMSEFHPTNLNKVQSMSKAMTKLSCLIILNLVDISTEKKI